MLRVFWINTDQERNHSVCYRHPETSDCTKITKKGNAKHEQK